MHATPIDAENCRSYWFTCHTNDDSAPETHLALQSVVLTEDLPLVASHRPRSIGEPHEEVSVPADKPDIIWRKWLRELAQAAGDGPSGADAGTQRARRVLNCPADASSSRRCRRKVPAALLFLQDFVAKPGGDF